MREHIAELLRVSSLSSRADGRLPTDELKRIYGASLTLGFTLSQHFSAVDRLGLSDSWQAANEDIWGQLKAGTRLCGLATTHIARIDGPTLKGRRVNGGYTVTGRVPWTSGFRIFDHLLIGFSTIEEVVFGVIQYPRCLDAPELKIFPHDLSVVDGSSSVAIDFHDCFLSESSVVSSRMLGAASGPRQTPYIGNEIGLGIRALQEVEKEVTGSAHPRHLAAGSCLQRFDVRLRRLRESLRSAPMDAEVTAQLHKFIREAVQLLIITTGSRALMKGSVASRMQSELMLFDVIIQSPLTIEKKIAALAGD